MSGLVSAGGEGGGGGRSVRVLKAPGCAAALHQSPPAPRRGAGPDPLMG